MNRFVISVLVVVVLCVPVCLLAQQDSTVEKGLAIETSGSMDVFNDAFNSTMAVFNEFISPALSDDELFNELSNYEKSPAKIQSARHILYLIHSDVFTKDKVNFSNQNVNSLSQALTPDPVTKKLTFDCDTSAYVYLQILEYINKNVPVVLVRCSDHMLLRWKLSDGTSVNWETTAGVESSQKNIKRYNEDCRELVPGSDAFYSMFYLDRAFIKEGLKDYADAVNNYDQSIELDPTNDIAYGGRAFLKQLSGDYVGAVADYDKAIEISPKYADGYVFRGNVKGDLRDFNGAIADYSKAISLDPNYAGAYLNRGVARSITMDIAGALADFDKVLELDPTNVVALNNREIIKNKRTSK